jgi:hypothetical protein
MSLLDEAKEQCVMLDRQSRSDGRGGIIYNWTDGADFSACIYLENSLNQMIAEAQGVKGVYQITVDKAIRLAFNDVFRRVSDGRTFRVTSRDDNETPDSAALNMRVVRAEDYILEQ